MLVVKIDNFQECACIFSAITNGETRRVLVWCRRFGEWLEEAGMAKHDVAKMVAQPKSRASARDQLKAWKRQQKQQAAAATAGGRAAAEDAVLVAVAAPKKPAAASGAAALEL